MARVGTGLMEKCVPANFTRSRQARLLAGGRGTGGEQNRGGGGGEGNARATVRKMVDWTSGRILALTLDRVKGGSV